MRHEHLFLSISSLPWGSVWTVSIQTLNKQETNTVSSSVDGDLYPTWPNPAPRLAARKPTNCNIGCICEFVLLLPQIISHILEGTCWMKCKHILAELLIVWLCHCYCQYQCWHGSLVCPDCISTCGHAGNQGAWQVHLENVFSWWWPADTFQVHCYIWFSTMCNIWNWISSFITEIVFVLVESSCHE